MTTMPITKANIYNPILPVCNFLPCFPILFVINPKLKITFPNDGSNVVLKKLDKIFQGLQIIKL